MLNDDIILDDILLDDDLILGENILTEIDEAAIRWTKVSVMCYERECNCKGCYYEKFFESGRCLCKYVVLHLLKKCGEPTSNNQA